MEAEWPKAARGVGVVGGIPFPRGEGSEEGAAPLPEFFFSILDLKMASFGAVWVPVGDASSIPLDPLLNRHRLKDENFEKQLQLKLNMRKGRREV